MPDETQLEADIQDDAKSVVFDSVTIPERPLDTSHDEAGKVYPVDEPVVEKVAGPSVDPTLRKQVEDIVRDSFKSFLNGLNSLPGRKVDPAESSFKSVGNAWVATYSNNLKDRDGEIFPARAIDQYIQRVDKGLVPLPELWVWHAGKSSRVGQAGVVARQGHFVLAAGTWDDTPQGQTARTFYAKHQKDTSLSHGFTYNKRAFDGKHYWDFNTFEISLLPRGAEANRFTTLEGVKAMQISDEKKKYLIQAFGEETVKQIVAEIDGRDKEVDAMGVEFKDFGHVEAEPPAEPTTENKALGELVVDLIGGQSEGLKAALAAVKEVKALEARIAKQDETIATFIKEQWENRPRMGASDHPDTVLSEERLKALAVAASQPDTVRDSFWFPKG